MDRTAIVSLKTAVLGFPIYFVPVSLAGALVSHDIRAGSVAGAIGHQLADESADGFHDFFVRFGLLS